MVRRKKTVITKYSFRVSDFWNGGVAQLDSKKCTKNRNFS